MVRINLLDPEYLTDQHLVAEYNEILMLLGYVQRYPLPDGIPPDYLLGPGHIKFFKDKLRYLKDRHELLKTEMRARGFTPTRSIKLSDYPKGLQNDWSPSLDDAKLIKKRLKEKIKMKSGFYRYYGEPKSQRFLLELVRKATLPPRARSQS